MPDTVITALIGALATIAAAAIGVIWKRSQDPKEAPDLSSSREALTKKNHKFDVFVSAPMASFTTDEEIRGDHDRIAPAVAFLEDQLGLSVYWAGRNIRSRADFDAPDISATRDVDALLTSKYFLLLYPAKIASSVLFEAGIALRSCLTSLYFVRSAKDLPFLMAQASQAFKNVRIYEGALPADLVALLRRHGKDFFLPRATGS
jgi:hypothetical protein